MKPETKSQLWWLAAVLLVFALGVLEGWYGRFDYTGDALAYLDVSKAISRGDWALALSPYWSIGYPAVLAATRWIFPPGAQGDWISEHVINMVIFVATYVSFLSFLKAAIAFAAKREGVADPGPATGFVFTGGTIIFVTLELFTSSVSRVSPDLLVTTFFFLIMAASLRFCLNGRARTAVLLGFLMGLGYLIKAILLPLSLGVLGVVFLYAWTRPPNHRWSAVPKLAWALPALALVALPYMAAMSKVLGSWTTGETGALNYAWCVNGLICFEGWEGGPAPFGAPIHPPRLVLANPPVFEFAEPFHVTYPPWYNPYYWYEGYHHFFSLRNQITTLRDNILRLSTIFFDTPHAPLKLAAALALLFASSFLLKEGRTAWRRGFVLWPLWLPSIIGVALYLVVTVTARYLVGFLVVLSIVPLVVLFVPKPLVGVRQACAILIAVSVIGACYLVKTQIPTLRRAVHNESYTNTDQWRVGAYLAKSIVYPGEKVASVQVANHADNAGRTWATVSGVRIVAEIGNDAYDLGNQQEDFALFIGNPAVQQTVFALFRKAGAELVVARNVEGMPQGPGWEQIPGTRWWVHRL
jgi:hypothetical protein